MARLLFTLGGVDRQKILAALPNQNYRRPLAAMAVLLSLTFLDLESRARSTRPDSDASDGQQMADRYDLREDDDGLTVYDLWTGQVVVIAGVLQEGLVNLDAAELVTRLNERARQGFRDLLQ